ncbi:hypothetical protein BU23DRAFT_95462 [Bimuria novae-zelandiae CBS 107.79]|uniref:Uncharacterized protein n=1 Tax=Bimuria novae-zelandiae CBS 107.79 TaxID=1447943 RepID=A0A6A5VHP0_9PLEO|nr:hypothetical protein BU23DRAFT_95462 [Bimuria novae-zelandiae CBS 107.79]
MTAVRGERMSGWRLLRAERRFRTVHERARVGDRLRTGARDHRRPLGISRRGAGTMRYYANAVSHLFVPTCGTQRDLPGRLAMLDFRGVPCAGCRLSVCSACRLSVCSACRLSVCSACRLSVCSACRLSVCSACRLSVCSACRLGGCSACRLGGCRVSACSAGSCLASLTLALTDDTLRPASRPWEQAGRRLRSVSVVRGPGAGLVAV